MNAKEIIRDVERYGRFVYGRGEYILHLRGHALNDRQRILAACYRCSCYYEDSSGKTLGIDCKMPECPLYPVHPFREETMTATPPQKKRREILEKMVAGLP